MASFNELAALSKAVYDFGALPSGWRQFAKGKAGGNSYASGLQAAAYTNGADKVVAFRGTDGSNLAGDVRADAMLGVGMNTTYFAAAEDYVAGLADAGDVILCGHSLGGAIAQIVGNRRSLRFATFNAPGVAVLFSKNIWSANLAMLKIRMAGSVVSAVASPGQAWADAKAIFNACRGKNIRLRLDPVSATGVHYGDVISLETPTWNPIEAHKIDTVIKALGACDTGKLKI